MNGRVHIIGAGLAGLAAAVRLVEAGRAVTVHEAAGHAGGRCRSFHDAVLDRVIDNGNHLVLSGNHAARAYLAAIGAETALGGPSRAAFPFVDFEDGREWTVRPDRGAIPWSIFRRRRRVPGTGVGDYLSAWRLARATPSHAVGDCLRTDGPLWRRFWHPVIVSILNTDPAKASASLLWAVLKETFGRGETACRPLIAMTGLSEAFVDPALAYLRGKGGDIRLNHRIREIAVDGGRVGKLVGKTEIDLNAGDSVILAVPPTAARRLFPALTVPERFQPIVNGHFVLSEAVPATTFVGIVGGVAEWLFVRGDVASVTVSAAERLAGNDDREIARVLWHDIRKALKLGDADMGPYRIIKEKRATFEQTPAQAARRPGTRTALANLFLAGDWTDTGLPATIEGTVRSGFSAASAAAGSRRK